MLLWTAGWAHAQTGAPVATDDAYESLVGQTLVVESPGVLGNDTDSQGQDLPGGATAVQLSDVTNGTLALASDGSFTYTPANGFNGTDTFTYQAQLGGQLSNVATVQITVTGCSVGPTVTVCWDEGSYLAALADLGYATFMEGFESDAAWGSARSPNSVSSVARGGITWTSNNATSGLTTSSGAARTGSWGLFSNPHGNAYGVACDHNPGRLDPCLYDGFAGTGPRGLTAVGGWVMSNTGGAQVQFKLDGVIVAFPDPTLTGTHRFFGAIDAGGFTSFEVRETQGSPQDQQFIFADDFVFGLDPTVPRSPVGLRISP